MDTVASGGYRKVGIPVSIMIEPHRVDYRMKHVVLYHALDMTDVVEI